MSRISFPKALVLTTTQAMTAVINTPKAAPPMDRKREFLMATHVMGYSKRMYCQFSRVKYFSLGRMLQYLKKEMATKVPKGRTTAKRM